MVFLGELGTRHQGNIDDLRHVFECLHIVELGLSRERDEDVAIVLGDVRTRRY